MAYTLEQSKDEVAQLVKLFATNRAKYLSPAYKEAHARQELIDPLFIALNWDVHNQQRAAPDYREVVVEDSLEIEGQRKAPDYAFRIGDKRKFLGEAKKPGLHLKNAAGAAYQIRRYAWSAKLPLSVLTDFEELAAYDCRIRPSEKDKSSVARRMYLPCVEYADRWHEIWDVFSRDAVLGGSFDEFALPGTGRGTSEVDAEFLKEIEGWRDVLARNMAIRNPHLAIDELNDAVQRTIDRIIFFRMAEDRGIEEYGRLQRLAEREGVYGGLIALSRQADTKYDSGLFDFSRTGDRLTPRLTVDDKVLKPILTDLYYPQPYEFSVLPVEILGNVYEQFLGKVIRLTPSHHAKVEEKPEVKKAGGVYYTPAHIVEYIVRNTVGKRAEGKSPKQLDTFRVLDPACGSGSFLLGAYQCLLEYYLGWYVAHGPERRAAAVWRPGDAWRLTTSERKRILTRHIFGVDIDRQAVEVTKLSLLLKVLENESDETLGKQLALFHERALPNLDRNIKCGNSLIAPDFFANQLMADGEELRRVNPFDWEREFPEAMQAGGFDCVIGNPPYIFTRNQGIDEAQKRYFYEHYEHQSPQLNTFGLFVENSYGLMCRSARLGFITPNNWLTIDSFAPLRRFILESTGSVKVVNILDRVFADASVDTAITFFERGKPSDLTIAEMSKGEEAFSRVVSLSAAASPAYIIQISLLKDARSSELLKRIEGHCRPLGELCTVSTGLKVYQTGKGKPPQSDYEKENRVFHATSKRNKTYGKYLDGVDVSRYHLGWSGEYLSYGDWLAEPRKSVPFAGERLLVRQIPSKPPYLVHGTLAEDQSYNDINSMVVFAPVGGVSLKYLLGIINSRLLSFWFLKTYDKLQRKVFPQFKVKELASFPIRPVNLSDPADEARHNKMVALVEQSLDLRKRQAEARDSAGRERLQRVIDATDNQIDEVVYELYELTPEGITVVEAANT